MGPVQVHRPLPDDQGIAPWVVPHFVGRQQPCRPLRRFDPRHVGVGLSGASSPYGYGQSHRGFFRRLELHVSTFLHPFAPPELPGFDATMGALTPVRRFFASTLRLAPWIRSPSRTMNAAWTRTGLPVSCHQTVGSFRLQPPVVVPERFWGFLLPGLPYHGSRGRPLPRTIASIGLRLSLAGSPRRPAESSSLALRTDRSPRVALHPASRRCSYLWLRSARTLRQGLTPR
jgi:hypothetical protein